MTDFIIIGAVVLVFIVLTVMYLYKPKRVFESENQKSKPIFFCYNIDGKKGCTTQCRECEIREAKSRK